MRNRALFLPLRTAVRPNPNPAHSARLFECVRGIADRLADDDPGALDSMRPST
jgi:hypothetical protein